MARWTFFEHARRPATWALAGLLAVGWPAILTFGRLGITTRDGPSSRHFYELAFISALLGASLGVATLARGSWLLERASPTRRLAAEAGGLVGAIALPFAAAVLPAAFLAPRAAGLGAATLPLAATLAHLVALGLLALRCPAPHGLRGLVLPALAWVLPALLGAPTQGRLDSGLRAAATGLFDAARHGRLGLELGPDMAHRWGAWLPISALVGAAWLLAERAPSVHALRHPR